MIKWLVPKLIPAIGLWVSNCLALGVISLTEWLWLGVGTLVAYLYVVYFVLVYDLDWQAMDEAHARFIGHLRMSIYYANPPTVIIVVAFSSLQLGVQSWFEIVLVYLWLRYFRQAYCWVRSNVRSQAKELTPAVSS